MQMRITLIVQPKIRLTNFMAAFYNVGITEKGGGPEK